MMFNQYNDLLSVADVAEILTIGMNTAYKLLNDQSIKAFRIGHAWRIPKDALIEYIYSSSNLSKK